MDATQVMEKGTGESPTPSPPGGEVFDKDKSLYGNASESERERDVYEEGMQKYNRLGWKRLTVVLIVEAIALGSLSIPAAFASLGMVAGVICSVGIGLIAIYTAYIVGKVKVNFPQVANYPDAGRLMGGRWGYEVVNAMLILQLLFLVGSHCLTGTIAFQNITGSGVCSIIFAVVSAIILMIIAIPPSFTEVAILGYIDFASIILAIGITIIATGVESTKAPGGLSAVNWSAWPKEGLTFTEGFIAITNICFAYSFAMCQFSFMDEMHTPTDYMKSVYTLGLAEIFIYTVTGGLIYAFVGQEVKSPALLSAGPLVSRIAFGIALPVIFISGSINTTVLGRLVHTRIFKNSNTRFVNTRMGWITWIIYIIIATIAAFIIAEVIPFFSDLLSISSSLFISGFTFYLPALMWFMLLREGKWNTPKNLMLGALNLCVFAIGIVVLVAGIYSSVDDIVSWIPPPPCFPMKTSLTKPNRFSATALARSGVLSLAVHRCRKRLAIHHIPDCSAEVFFFANHTISHLYQYYFSVFTF